MTFDNLYKKIRRDIIRKENLPIPVVDSFPQFRPMDKEHRKKIRKNPYLSKGINSLTPSSLSRKEKFQLVKECYTSQNTSSDNYLDSVLKVNALLSKGDKEVAEIGKEIESKLWDEYSKKEGSTFIHSDDYQPMNCVICGAYMPTIHDTNNPFPYTAACFAKDAYLNKREDRCCSSCDTEIVLPLRHKTKKVRDWWYHDSFKKECQQKDGGDN